MIFRIYFKDKGRSVDVYGDTLSYSSAVGLITIDKSGKCVGMVNINEIICVKTLNTPRPAYGTEKGVVKTNKKILRRALEMAIYNFIWNCDMCPIHETELEQCHTDPDGRQRRCVSATIEHYIRRATAEIKGERK